MGRTTQVISISVPPEMTGQIDRLAKDESRTRSELLREALRRYLEEQTWRKIFNYGTISLKFMGNGELNIRNILDPEKYMTAIHQMSSKGFAEIDE